MSKSQRDKGHNFERWCAQQLRRVFPDAKRNVTETQTGGQGVDIINTGAFAVQCKRYKNYAPISKIEEVNAPSYWPMLITKGDRNRTMVVLPLDALIEILADVGVAYETPEQLPF